MKGDMFQSKNNIIFIFCYCMCLKRSIDITRDWSQQLVTTFGCVTQGN